LLGLHCHISISVLFLTTINSAVAVPVVSRGPCDVIDQSDRQMAGEICVHTWTFGC